jgi:hypothetical protein
VNRAGDALERFVSFWDWMEKASTVFGRVAAISFTAYLFVRVIWP